ncbi:MAG: hypothetical protein ACREDZ_00520 [Kiloniellales bacterium]
MSPDSTRPSPLPAIPLHDIGEAGAPALLAREPERARALLAAGTERYGPSLIGLFDALSARWLACSSSPYRREIEEVALALGTPGVRFLNVSYEWGCSSGVVAAPGGGMRLVRVLDWPLDGLGRHLVAARQRGHAGEWINLTWPGFAGAIQGLAPGRFAAAFNQAPMASATPFLTLDWAINRVKVWRRRALPPAHLLRQTFEQAASYADAKRRLVETPIALPAIFLLAGPREGEGCVIERGETAAYVLEAPVCAANHWQKLPYRARPRGAGSRDRAAALADSIASSGMDLAWFEPPIRNEASRLVMLGEPASGSLFAQGIEAEAPATQALRLSA